MKADSGVSPRGTAGFRTGVGNSRLQDSCREQPAPGQVLGTADFRTAAENSRLQDRCLEQLSLRTGSHRKLAGRHVNLDDHVGLDDHDDLDTRDTVNVKVAAAPARCCMPQSLW